MQQARRGFFIGQIEHETGKKGRVKRDDGLTGPRSALEFSVGSLCVLKRQTS